LQGFEMNFRHIACLLLASPLFAPTATAQPVPIIGEDAALCASGSGVPAALIHVNGLIDRSGVLRAELYPATDQDWLGDRKRIVAEGKTHRRVVAELPVSGPVQICVKLPRPGVYAFAIIHQRGPSTSFAFTKDGIGFTNNPRLYFSKPAAAKVAYPFGPETTSVSVIMNYKRGLSMKPLPVR
jgi:uncharacterized protein (DUF2141 family)